MKPRINNNYILTAALLVLIVLCWLSVSQPMSFQREVARREKVVKQRLAAIRQAEEHYCQMHGAYTGDFATLVSTHCLADSLQYIPYAGKKKFQLAASTVTTKTGKQIPVMSCSATYHDYLSGMDSNGIATLIEDAADKGNYPGLQFGNIAEDSGNRGNWE